MTFFELVVQGVIYWRNSKLKLKIHYMKRIVFSLVFLTLTSLASAQTVDHRSYKKAKIYLDNHQIIKVNNLEINSTEAAYLNAVNNKKEKISINNVNLIRVPKGSHIKEGALFGAGTMALTALLIDIQPDPFGIEQKHGAGFYVGLTAGGAAVGALVGSFFPKWKEIYSNGKFIGLNLPVNFDFSVQNDDLTFIITLQI